jgi:glycosyltransferase involved in cell wall biosynthesis
MSEMHSNLGRVAYLTAGAGGMFCGSCMHDNTLVKGLIRQGVDAVLIPTYTPIRTDEDNVSQQRVFFGGINVFMRQKMPWLRFLPGWSMRWLDNPRLLRWVASRAMKTKAADLGDLTVSMLCGSDGPQRDAVKQLVDWLEKDVQPTIVVLSNMLIAGCVPEIKRRLKVPVLITLQGDDIFLHDLPDKHFQECRQLLAKLDEHVDGYVTNSRFYADFMATDLSLSPDKFHVTPLCIDTGDFCSGDLLSEAVTDLAVTDLAVTDMAVAGSESLDDNNVPLVVGYLARLAPEKGLHLLADAFIQLVKEGTVVGRPVHLKIAGWLGPQNREYAEGVFTKLRDAGLADQFEYIGEIDRAEKATFLKAVDVLSVPTVYKEPKGLFVLEALASGVPVVQPNHGAFPEVLARTGGGVLFEPGDSSDLACKLSELLNDAERRIELGDQGRAAVLREFNLERMADAAIELYRGLVLR